MTDVCPKGHRLCRRQPLVRNEATLTCESCQNKWRLAQKKFYGCAECDYDLCETCYEPSEAEPSPGGRRTRHTQQSPSGASPGTPRRGVHFEDEEEEDAEGAAAQESDDLEEEEEGTGGRAPGSSRRAHKRSADKDLSAKQRHAQNVVKVRERSVDFISPRRQPGACEGAALDKAHKKWTETVDQHLEVIDYALRRRPGIEARILNRLILRMSAGERQQLSQLGAMRQEHHRAPPGQVRAGREAGGAGLHHRGLARSDGR